MIETFKVYEAERAVTEIGPEGFGRNRRRALTLAAANRQRILAAMLDLVGEQGYDVVSPTTVAARAGLSADAFHGEFASADECFAHAYEAAMAEVEARVEAAAPRSAAWEVRLRAGLEAMLEMCEREPLLGRVLVVEVNRAGGRAPARRAETMRRATEFLAAGRAGGRFEPSAPATEATVAGMHALLHRRLARGDAGDYRDLLGELMYVAVLPFGGPGAAAAAGKAG